MIEYVEGMGDYWIRLVEQMIPATTIWNTGVKLENSIFHRQKFVWRRQRGCELAPIICKPCKFTGSVYKLNCDVWYTLCNRYPKNALEFNTFSGVFSDVITQWEDNNDVSGCYRDGTIISEWFVDISINGTNIIQDVFFDGVGYSNPVGYLCGDAMPCVSAWETALNNSLSTLILKGYDYRYEHGIDDNLDLPPTKVRIWNTNCSVSPLKTTITINLGINFTITCPQ